MKVITLNQEMLKKESQKLAKLILESDWKPELVIGIKTGGVYVAEPVYQQISEQYKCSYLTLSLSRPSTEKKKRFKIEKLLKQLPYFLLNILRNLEVFIFEQTKSKTYIPYREKDLHLDESFVKELYSYENIILVDDAIDTGTTIIAIKNRLLAINPHLNIKTAVLTITHKVPFIEADYSLYKRVLLRCPWAADYKGETYET